eukprot:3950129-Prymnesium_polylepis.1
MMPVRSSAVVAPSRTRSGAASLHMASNAASVRPRVKYEPPFRSQSALLLRGHEAACKIPSAPSPADARTATTVVAGRARAARAAAPTALEKRCCCLGGGCMVETCARAALAGKDAHPREITRLELR